MENNHPLSELMRTTLDSVRAMADANTIVGAPIQADGVTLIPVSKLSFGRGRGRHGVHHQKAARRRQRPSAAAAEPAPSWSRWAFLVGAGGRREAAARGSAPRYHGGPGH